MKGQSFARNGGGGVAACSPNMGVLISFLVYFGDHTFIILCSNCCSLASLTSRIVKPENYFFGQEAIAPPPPDENVQNCTGMVLLI